MTLLALVFFTPVAVAAALALTAPHRQLLPVARATALGAAAACILAAAIHQLR